MEIIEIFILSFALSIDTASVALGVSLQQSCSLKQTMRMSCAFAFFHGIMLIIGWTLGTQAHDLIDSYAHWIAFAVFAYLGGKMLFESTQDSDELTSDPTKGYTLFMLSIVTSIDALGIGISFSALEMSIEVPVLIIVIVCFSLTALVMLFGRVVLRESTYLSVYANKLGGILLILLGLDVLYEHNVF